MSLPKTIPVRRQTLLAMVICLAISTAAHLFRIAIDLTHRGAPMSQTIVICVTALLITLIWASTKHQPKGK